MNKNGYLETGWLELMQGLCSFLSGLPIISSSTPGSVTEWISKQNFLEETDHIYFFVLFSV